MIAVDWPALLDALSRVEQLGPEDSGLLSFGAAEGGIFVERGRICWAAAQGLQRRLRDLLHPLLPVSEVELERTYEDCRAEGRLFGQHLVARGLVEPHAFERALRRHSAESLVKLCRSPRTPTWFPRQGRGYSPRFTFRPVDVLFDLVDLTLPGLRIAATAELTPLLGPDRRAVSFLVGDTHEPPIPLTAFAEHSSVASLRSFGHWAAGLQAATRELAVTPSLTLATAAAGQAVCLWWRGRVLHAMICDDRSSLASVTAHHLARA